MFSAERTLSVCAYGRNLLLRSCFARYGQCDDVNKRFVRFKSHYEVLGVDKNANQAKIKEQFIKLSKQCHPDLSTDKKGSHEKFVRLNEAYKVLNNKTSRSSYDAAQRYGYQTTDHPYTHTHRPPGQNMHGHGGPFGPGGPYGPGGPWDHNFERRRQNYRNRQNDAEQIRFISFILVILSTGMAFHFIAFRATQMDARNDQDMKYFMMLHEARVKAKQAGSTEASLNNIQNRILDENNASVKGE